MTESRNDWIKTWGQRPWTLPELVFCPNSDGIPVYTLHEIPPETMSKLTIANILRDGKKVRKLVEHYNGTLQLSPLELTVSATKCLFARPHTTYGPGDTSYTLMGLMRRQPGDDPKNSAFKAFARLSLLNDNDRLLERLICLRPSFTKRWPWYSLQDLHGASLWGIEPCTHVVGIVDTQPARAAQSQLPGEGMSDLDETQIIVLDGAYSATIIWQHLAPVAFEKRLMSSGRWASFFVRYFRYYFPLGIITTITASILITRPDTCDDSSYLRSCSTYVNSSKVIGSVFMWFGPMVLGICAVVISYLPACLRRMYAGKLWSTQAAFFGMSGIPDWRRSSAAFLASTRAV